MQTPGRLADGYVGYRIGWPVGNRGTSALLHPCPGSPSSPWWRCSSPAVRTPLPLAPNSALAARSVLPFPSCPPLAG